MRNQGFVSSYLHERLWLDVKNEGEVSIVTLFRSMQTTLKLTPSPTLSVALSRICALTTEARALKYSLRKYDRDMTKPNKNSEMKSHIKEEVQLLVSCEECSVMRWKQKKKTKPFSWLITCWHEYRQTIML